MKKTLLLPLLAAALALTACGKPGEPSQKLVVAATAVPHAEILDVVKPIDPQAGRRGPGRARVQRLRAAQRPAGAEAGRCQLLPDRAVPGCLQPRPQVGPGEGDRSTFTDIVVSV